MQLDHILKVYCALYLSVSAGLESGDHIKSSQLSCAACLGWDKWQKSSFPVSSQAQLAWCWPWHIPTSLSPLLCFPAGFWCWPWLLGPGEQCPREPCVTWVALGEQGLCSLPWPWQCRSILCMACRVLPAPPRVKSLWFCCQTLGNSYPLQVPRGLLCLAFLTFLLRMCTKKSRGQPSNFWVVNELLLPSPPCLTLSCMEIELRIPGEENSLMIPP